MFTDFFVRGGQCADDPRFASNARDARIFCMSHSEKCPPLAIWLGGGKMSVGGGALGWGGVHVCDFNSILMPYKPYISRKNHLVALF